jgi:hypothetical protein
MPTMRFLLRLLLLLLVLPTMAHASVTKGEVKGTVLDEGGLSVPGVLITVSSDNLMGVRQIETGAEGRFRFIELPPGVYVVKAEMAGFTTHKNTNVPVNIGRTATVNIELRLAVAGLEIVVEDTASVIDTESGNRGSVLTKEFLARIPAGRSYQSAVQLAAGVTGGSNPNVGGSSSRENTYLLDGVNITDPVTGTFSLNFNFDAIEQIEVLTSAFDPEYGALGAAINVVTDSGSNILEVLTGVYVTNGTWSPKIDERVAADGLQLAPTDFDSTYESYEVSLRISGPVIRDKAWFIASYSMRRTLIATAGVKTPRDFDGHYVLSKLTMSPNSSHRFTVLTQTNPTSIDNLYYYDRFVTPEAQGTQAQGGYVLSLQWDWYISPEMFLETKATIQKTYIERHQVPCTHNQDLLYNPCEEDEFGNSVDFETPARLGQSYARDQLNYPIFDFDDRWRLNFQSKYSILQLEAAGSHDIKAGVDTSLLIWDKTFGYTGNMYFTDINILPYNPDTYTNYFWVEISGPLNYVTSAETFGVFIQDVYKPVDNLTLRYGARYDRQVTRNDVGTPILNAHLLGPRVSIIWDPWGDAKTKVTASFGRFFDGGRLGVADYISQSGIGSKLYLGEFFSEYTSNRSNDYSFAPIENLNTVGTELTMPKADAFTVGGEREVIQDLALGAYFNGKFTRNLYAFDELNTIWDQDGYNVIGYADGTTTPLYRLRTPAIARRDYYRADLQLKKVMSNRWQAEGSYSYTISRGTNQNTPSGFLIIPTQVKYYVNGLLASTDIRHSVKLSGFWEIPDDPWTTTLGSTLIYESGYPLSRSYASLSAGGFNSSYLMDTYGSYARTEGYIDWAILIRQAIPVRKGELQADMQVFNFINSRRAEGAAISSDNRWIIGSRVEPLRIQLGARYEF